MKQYEAYTDSGIQWLGKIPSHWDITPLKFNLSLKGRIGWNGLKSDEFKEDSYAYLVTGQDFIGKDIDWSACYQIDRERYEEDPFIQLANGDLLVTKDGTIGKIARVRNLDKPACLNSGIFVVKQVTGIYNQDFLYWTLFSSQLSEFNSYMSTGSTIQHLYQNVFENMPLVVPPLAEQEVIAAYLDQKVGKIDAILSEKEAMVEQLQQYRKSLISETVTRGLDPNVPMKDSGIDWIGQIPQHWITCRIKHVLEHSKDCLRVGPFGSSLSGNDFTDKGFWVYNQRTVLDNNFSDNDSFVSEEKFNELSNFRVSEGDFLITTRGTIGKVAIVPKGFSEGVLHPCIIRFRVDEERINKDFLKYIFNDTDLIATQVKYNSNSTTIDVIYSYTLKELQFALPPIQEQTCIVDFLKGRISQIDNTISELQSQIEDFKAYKSSVITEAVTGKVDLRDWKPSEVTA